MATLYWADLIGIGASKPAAGIAGRLYYDTSDSTLYRDNGSTWESVEGAPGLDNPMTDAGDMVIGGTAGAPARLAKSTDGKLLTLVSGAPAWAASAGDGGFPYQFRIPVWKAAAYAGTQWFYSNDTCFYNGYMTSGGANTDYVEWPVMLCAGTWQIDIVGVKDTNRGIITVSLGGSSVGTLDFYAASRALDSVGTLTGVTVASNGTQTLRLSSPTKNASSSAYYMTPAAVFFTRTGD